MRTRMVGWLTLAALVLLGSGCVETRIVRDGWADWYDLADQDQSEQKRSVDAALPAASEQMWAIHLASFDGKDRGEKATTFVRRLREECGADGWVREIGEEVHVYRGPFMQRRSDTARAALRETRSLSVPGFGRLRDAEMTAVPDTETEAESPWDLSNYHNLYTLQIGFYDDNYQGSRWKAAEEAVRVLREEGHEAYFYHGPVRSMVTIGLFDYDESHDPQPAPYDPQVRIDGPSETIRQLQEEFPYNLANGRTMIQKKNGKVLGKVPSALARVP
ncbi:MAG: hypothetical protein ACOCTI_07115 [Phycisphaeraceae bacterium]